MSRVEGLWERLVRAALRDRRVSGHVYGQPEAGLAANVPSSLGNKDIDDILRAADEIQADDPNISRILCEHAYSLAQNLDPNSEGRGVLQFKTGLMSVIKQKLAKREGGSIDRSQHIARLQEFCKHYREKHNADKLREEETKLRESGFFSGNLGVLEHKTLKRKRVLATLKVLGNVLEQLTNEVSLEEAERLIPVEETICLQCGNKGYDNAFVFCVKCVAFAVHRYCLDVVPEDFDEFVHWVCDDCEAEQTRIVSTLKNFEKDGIVSIETEEHVYEDFPQHLYDACTKKKKKTLLSSEANLEEQNQENNGVEFVNHCVDMRMEGVVTCTSNGHGENGGLEVGKEFPKDTNMLECSTYTEPIITPIWSGSFNVSGKSHDILDGLKGHVSSKACQKVYEEISLFQPDLHLKMLPNSDVWPKRFESSDPNEEDIALFFFPSEISEPAYDRLIDEMRDKDLALKGVVQNAEILIFTSMVLPLLYWRFKKKYYLWGVFRAKQPPSIGSQFTYSEIGE